MSVRDMQMDYLDQNVLDAAVELHHIYEKWAPEFDREHPVFISKRIKAIKKLQERYTEDELEEALELLLEERK